MADRLEIAIAALTSITANVHRDHKERPEPFKAEDFMVRRQQPKPDESAGSGEGEGEENGMEPEQVAFIMGRFMRRQEQRAKAIQGRSTS